MIKQSFTLRVLVASFLLLALPLLIDSFIFFQDSYKDAIKDAKTDLRQAANLRSFTLSEIQPVKQVLLGEVDYMLGIGEKIAKNQAEELSKELEVVSKAGGGFQLFVLTEKTPSEYEIFSASLPDFIGTTFTSYIKLPHILETGEGDFIRYLYSEKKNRYIPHIFVARTIHAFDTHQPVGMLMVTADIEEALKIVVKPSGHENQISFAVLNTDGIAFAATNPDFLGKYFDPITEKRRNEILALNQMGKTNIALSRLPEVKGDDPPFFEFVFDNQIQIGYRAYISDVGLSVVSYSSKEEFFGRAVRHFLLIYTLYGLILVFGGAVAYWLSLLISRPLRKLSTVMGEVKQGNMNVRFEREPLGFEINLLGEIFNDTLDKLLTNIQKAEDERVKKETSEREVAIGQQVQQSLLPSMVPEIKGASLASVYLPAREAGGDFFTYTEKGEEKLFITVADASGKGISPCLYSLSARSLLRSYISLYNDPGEILSHTNNAFIADTGDSGMFVTMVTAAYAFESRALSYYSCGHPPPLIRRSDGHLTELKCDGIAVGLKPSESFASRTVQLERGDLVLLYTDGLTKEPYSKEHLERFLQKKEWNSAQDLVDAITAKLPSQRDEEIIIVALKVEA